MDVSFAAIFMLAWFVLAVLVSLLWGLIARNMANDRDAGPYDAGRRGDRRRHPHTETA